jgi:multidrug resistance efflux pump
MVSSAEPAVTTDTRTAVPAVAPAAPRRSAFAKRLPLLLIVVVGGGAFVGWEVWTNTRPYEWSGTVEARTISVGSRVGGRIKDVRAKEGEQVAEDQPLLELEPGDLPAQRLIAKAELEQARANLEKLQKGARPEEIQQAKARAQTATAALEEARVGARSEQIAAARARLVASQVAADKAKLDADRAERLFATQAISQGQLDDAQTVLRGAFAQRDAVKQELDELQNGSRREDVAQAVARADEARASAQLVIAGSRVEDIEAAQAAVEGAQGRLDQMDVNIAELVVRAPRASRVESLDLRPGDIIGPNTTAATLIEEDQLYVRIYVPETQIGHIHPGQEVPIEVDSFPHRSFRGVVEHVNSKGEYSPRNLQTADERADQVFAARVGIREGADVLRAGMAAFIHVPK